ncbi:trans-1,2-dihydrobenzene-1,2-diol dehydrogenase-like [Acipenser ruthenus]|uniref:trans-1,2-dihydrobenzene-1,2-diol dehydrogenase-like n=1 Tax=Acipenser ruthenus TaxID=7906 RepID=UPI00274055AE|nr:trans-1,2-dihydrobenzene-1,2-diol dehydrogenase-like [Acipenser ruthenus]
MILMDLYLSWTSLTSFSTSTTSPEPVVAVAARELGRAQDFANRHNIPRAYGSYQELAQDKDIGWMRLRLVDEAATVVLSFSSNRMAVCICTVSVQLPNEAFIFGTKGTIKIPAPMWSPTSLIVNGNETQFPLPEPYQPLNFPNSTGLRYEAQEVRRCLLAGLKQSPRMMLEDTALLTSIRDEARRQVGVVYCQDAE